GNRVQAGGLNIDGIIEVKVTSLSKDTIISKILDQVYSHPDRPKTERFVTQLSKVYVPFVLVMAVLVSFLPPIISASYQFKEWIYKGLMLIVISCPCAIVISIPLAYFKAIGILSSKSILAKNISEIDELPKLKTIFFDKTGTITKGHLDIKDFILSEGVSKEEILNTSAALAQYSSHKISRSILHYLNYNLPKVQVQDFKEIPGYGILGNVDGIRIVVGNDKLLHRERIEHQKCIESSTVVHVAKDNKHLGTIFFEDDERKEAKNVLTKLREMGINTILLTGDNEINAKKIGKNLGFDLVIFGKNPEEKSEVIREFKRKTKSKVAYVGDGINDSLAMLEADIGISFNTPLNSITRIAADIVIGSSNLEKILETIVIAKNTRKIIIQNIILSLATKLSVGILGILGFMWLWLAVIADSGIALITVLNVVIKDFLKHRYN
ncbi:MAG: heavy metal translocating P-type ATPase, partial [Brevinematia bacterium]